MVTCFPPHRYFDSVAQRTVNCCAFNPLLCNLFQVMPGHTYTDVFVGPHKRTMGTTRIEPPHQKKKHKQRWRHAKFKQLLTCSLPSSSCCHFRSPVLVVAQKKDKNSTRQNYYVLTMSTSVYDAPNARNVVLTTKFVLISLPRFLRRRRGKCAFKLYRDEKYLGYLFKLLFTQQHSNFFFLL